MIQICPDDQKNNLGLRLSEFRNTYARHMAFYGKKTSVCGLDLPSAPIMPELGDLKEPDEYLHEYTEKNCQKTKRIKALLEGRFE